MSKRCFSARLVSSLLVTVCRLLTGIRSRWHSEPDASKTRIYYANHSSHLDGLVIWASLPKPLRETVHPVAAADYWLGSRLRRYLALQVFRAVLVERRSTAVQVPAPVSLAKSAVPAVTPAPQAAATEQRDASAPPAEATVLADMPVPPAADIAADVAAPQPDMPEVGGAQTDRPSPRPDPLEPLKQALAQQHSLILFPEGTRGDGEQLNAFKSGLYHLSKAWPEVELVPVWLDNLNRVLPKGSRLVVPIICSATFGSPLPGVQDGEDKQAFLDRTQSALEALAP